MAEIAHGQIKVAKSNVYVTFGNEYTDVLTDAIVEALYILMSQDHLPDECDKAIDLLTAVISPEKRKALE